MLTYLGKLVLVSDEHLRSLGHGQLLHPLEHGSQFFLRLPSGLVSSIVKFSDFGPRKGRLRIRVTPLSDGVPHPSEVNAGSAGFAEALSHFLFQRLQFGSGAFSRSHSSLLDERNVNTVQFPVLNTVFSHGFFQDANYSQI